MNTLLNTHLHTVSAMRCKPGRWLLGCLLAAGVAWVGPAGAAVVGVSSDTVVLMDINWTFTAADSGVTTSWTGLHWAADVQPTWLGAGWNVQAWYRHLDGPHGEGPEGSLHSMGSVTFISGFGAFSVMPIQDHDPPTFHAAAHAGLLAANGPAISAVGAIPDGFARQLVTHVPEPASALLLLGGMAALAGRRWHSNRP